MSSNDFYTILSKYDQHIRKSRKLQGISALENYVHSSHPIVHACVHASEYYEKCIQSTHKIPLKIINQHLRHLQVLVQPFTGTLYIDSFDPILGINKPKKTLEDVKQNPQQTTYSILHLQKQESKYHLAKYSHIVLVKDVPVVDISVYPNAFPNFFQNKVLILSNQPISYTLVKIVKTKTNTQLFWEIQPFQSTSHNSNSGQKLTPIQIKRAKESWLFLNKYKNWIHQSRDPELKECELDMYSFQPDQSLKFHQASNMILSLRYLAARISCIVYRGTTIPYPFVSHQATSFSLRDMKVGMTLMLNHPLSTSMNKQTALQFTSKIEKKNWKDNVRKSEYLHVFQLHNVTSILVPALAFKLRAAQSLAFNEYEVLVLPGIDVVFTLTQINEISTRENDKIRIGQIVKGYNGYDPDDDIKDKSLTYKDILKQSTRQKGLLVKRGRLEFVWDVSMRRKPDVVAISRLLHSVYNSGFAFPDWVNKFSYELDPHLDFRSTCVFYDSGFSKTQLHKLLLEREPCNIAMQPMYDLAKMKAQFGWDTSYYTRHFEKTGKLAPNIAVYIHTPIIIHKQIYSIHLLNLIGIAFDSEQQPDALFYSQIDIEQLRDLYVKVWRKAFHCAKYLGVTQISPVVVGGGAFSPVEPELFKTHIYDAVLDTLQQEFPSIQLLEKSVDVFQTIQSMKVRERNNTLFINAWDPHSILGNGNAMDQSMDGQYGRRTPMAILGWPATNPYMKYVKM